jgi:hypothetical protein
MQASKTKVGLPVLNTREKPDQGHRGQVIVVAAKYPSLAAASIGHFCAVGGYIVPVTPLITRRYLLERL